MEPDRGATTGMPRWVKVFGIVGLVVIVLFVILLLTGRGDHGPSRHAAPAAAHA
jgi:ABC-type transporter Mla subunit MlaD